MTNTFSPFPLGYGDLVFVKPRPNDYVGQLVAELTDGPFCHVRIVVSAFLSFEADTRYGVQRSTSAYDPTNEEIAHTGAKLLEAYRQYTYEWLLRQLGHSYSFWDIAADGFKLFLPKWLGSRTPFLVAPSQYDCSSLATQFLLLAGYQWLPDELIADPMRVSPNDLARAVGLIK